MNATQYRESSKDPFALRIVRLLPCRVSGPLLQELDCYGIRGIIASAVGVPADCPTEVRWEHGWQWDPITCVEQLAPYIQLSDCHLVATLCHSEFLKKRGYLNVHAVGMPILYVSQPKVARIPGSLLVMPPHSLSWTEHEWNEDAYIQFVLGIRSRFSSLTACISGPCVDHGYWCNSFEKAGIPWIRGAEAADQNALERVRMMFSMFEFMTTNTMGSHVAYASLSGCKVSIAGSYAALEAAPYKNDEFYQAHPEVLTANLERASEGIVREYYPEFFCDPDKAVMRVPWAEKALGKECMRSPREIAGLLGWPQNKRQLLRYEVRNFARQEGWPRRIAGSLFKVVRSLRRN